MIEIKKMFFVFSVLVLFSLVASNSYAFVSLSASGQTTSSTINAGEQTNLVITITNKGTDVASNLKLKFIPHPYIVPTQYQYDIGTIGGGNTQVFTVPIRVVENAPEGSTALIFDVDYIEGGGGTSTIESSVSIQITNRILIQVEGVTFSKSVIQKGDEVKMNVILKNVGKGNVKDLSASLQDYTLPFVYTESSKYLGNVGQGIDFNVTFTLIVNNDAATQAYNVPVSLSYFDEGGVSHNEIKYVGIKISGTPEFIVVLEGTENAYVGSPTSTIKLSIANRGTATANFLTAKFDSDLYVTPAEYYVGNLDPDDTTTISVNADLSKANAGRQSINMTLLYKNPYNEEYSLSKNIDFQVTNRPIEISTNTQIIIIVAIIVIGYWKRNFIKRLIKRK
jgi:hypothetical protein